MSDDFQQLKERLVKYSDEQLIDIVLAPPGDYRQEAIDIAKAELKWRRVELPDTNELEEEPAAPTPVEPFRVVREPTPGGGCVFCGGPVSPGTLVAEKELTFVFSDNREERFV